MDSSDSRHKKAVAFKSPKRFLADLEPAVTAKVVATAADVALVIENGVIKDLALSNPDIASDAATEWRGKKWIDTVTIESHKKIEDLLSGASPSGPVWRQVNHPSVSGGDIPIKYTAIRLRGTGRILALGRDLRSISSLQQRLVEAHQGIEREYDRLRESEARYRALFKSVSEAVLIVEAETGRIEDLNIAAGNLFNKDISALTGANLADLFIIKAHKKISDVLAEALAGGAAQAPSLKMKAGHECNIMASSFRLKNSIRIIVRVKPVSEQSAGAGEEYGDVLSLMPDALVVADKDLRILAVNDGFASMTRLAERRQATGRALVEFLGRSSTDTNVLISSIRTHGSVRNFATVLRDQFGLEESVEVSGVAAPSDKGDTYGLSIRNVSRRLETGARIGEQLPRSVDQLTGLVGKVPLKEIVKESTDLIEKLCIEAALEITADNRASAAEMLGMSRQGLYSKLKRFGFDE